MINENLEIRCLFKIQAEDKLARSLPLSKKDEECLYKCRAPICIDYTGPKPKPDVSYSVR